MDFVSVRELRTRSAAVWDALREEKDLVVTSNGKPIAEFLVTGNLKHFPHDRRQGVRVVTPRVSLDSGLRRY